MKVVLSGMDGTFLTDDLIYVPRDRFDIERYFRGMELYGYVKHTRWRGRCQRRAPGARRGGPHHCGR